MGFYFYAGPVNKGKARIIVEEFGGRKCWRPSNFDEIHASEVLVCVVDHGSFESAVCCFDAASFEECCALEELEPEPEWIAVDRKTAEERSGYLNDASKSI